MEAKDILEHHGIKGQRWGVRNKDSLARGPSSDHKKVAPLRSRPVHSLSNQQLKTVNERVNLEKNFNRLNPSKAKRGEAHIKSVVATLGLVSSIVGIVNSPIGKAAVSFINKNKSQVIKIKPGTSFN